MKFIHWKKSVSYLFFLLLSNQYFLSVVSHLLYQFYGSYAPTQPAKNVVVVGLVGLVLDETKDAVFTFGIEKICM